ncbi:MAG: dihydrofolate reductase [Candidatus Westeberhardia cardiocondylae]|nr:dihydrofolate reductase [Candidatus Westeberhardia cardiocondylae]
MMISIISAMSKNHVIGINNYIPWYLPNDLKWFKHNTINKPIIMGNNTYKSINKIPLPNRLNIILTKKIHKTKKNKNTIFVSNKKTALSIIPKKEKEIMIIGGNQIYNIFFKQANRLYLTHINIIIKGNVFFPKYQKNNWFSIYKKFSYADKNNLYDCFFEILQRH